MGKLIMEELFFTSKREKRVDIDNDSVPETIRIKLQKLTVSKNNELLWEKVIPAVFLSLKIADIDGDNEKEIITGASDKILRIYDKSGNLIKEIEIMPPGDKFSGWVWSIETLDVNNDGLLELVIGGLGAPGGKGGPLKVYDREGKLIWENFLDSTAYVINIFDIDGDGDKEIIVGTTRGTIYIFSKEGKEILKRNIEAPINDLKIGDLNNDGKPKIIVATAFGDIFLYNEKVELEWMSRISSYHKAFAFNIALWDINDDGKKEIIVTGRRAVKIFDSDGQVIASLDKNAPEGDIDGDGVAEKLYLGISHIYVYKQGKKIKKLYVDDLPEYISLIDINFDGVLEIGVALANGKTIIMDHNGNVITEFKLENPALSILCSDFDNDGKREIGIGGSLGEFKIFSCPGKELVYEDEFNGDIATILSGDINNDGELETIISTTPQAGEVRIIKFRSFQ